MRNRFPGTCYRCGERVEADQGHFEKHGRSWRVLHADCATRWRGKPAPTIAEAKQARAERVGEG